MSFRYSGKLIFLICIFCILFDKVYGSEREIDSPVSMEAADVISSKNFGLGAGGIALANKSLGFESHALCNFWSQDTGHTQLYFIASWANKVDGSLFSSMLSGETISMDTIRYSLTYRWVFNAGFFMGIGYGLSTGNITYNMRRISAGTTAKKRITYTFDSAFVPLDIGWMGTEGFFFNLGVQPSRTLFFRSSYKPDELASQANRDKISTLENFVSSAKDSTAIYFNFGFYIN